MIVVFRLGRYAADRGEINDRSLFFACDLLGKPLLNLALLCKDLCGRLRQRQRLRLWQGRGCNSRSLFQERIRGRTCGEEEGGFAHACGEHAAHRRGSQNGQRTRLLTGVLRRV